MTLVRLASERGLRTEIITNGTLLDAALARELVTLDVARVTVSLMAGMRSPTRRCADRRVNLPLKL